MQTEVDRIATGRNRNSPIASRCCQITAAVLLSLSCCDKATADSKYITQPSRMPKQVETPVTKAPNSNHPITVVDSLQVTAQEQNGQLIERSAPTTSTWTSNGKKIGTSRLEPVSTGSMAQGMGRNAASQMSVEKPGPTGLNWVKRQPRGTHFSEGTSDQALEFMSLLSDSGATRPQLSPQFSSPIDLTQEIELLPLEPAPAHRNQLTDGPSNSQFTESSNSPQNLLSQTTSATQALATQSNALSAQLTAGAALQNAHEEPRIRLASKVSRQIIGELDQQKQTPITPISMTSGWASIGRQLAAHLRQSEHLAARGVFLSAREEGQLALLLLVRYLDQLSNSFVSEPDLHTAQTALRESADFTEYHQTTDVGLLKQIVHSHETQLLKQSQLLQVSPVTLAEHYRKFAELKIIEASQNHPWFSDILYQMGRTYQAEADLTNNSQADHLRGLALVYYRAALAILPTNALASNQIGFVLLQQDRPLEAQQFLVASVDARLDTPALQNLVEASRRLQDLPMERWAMNTLMAIQSGRTTAEPMPIQLVDNATFASMSPPSAGPKTASQPHQSPGSPVATHSAPSTPMVQR